MANTVFKLRRSSVAGKVPNTSTVAIGELAINLTDKILYSSDGSNVFEIGANNTNVNVSNTLTVKAISANGSVGTSGQVLKSNGTSTYWATDNADIGAASQILYRNSSNVLTTSSGLQYDGSAVKVNGRIESLYQAGDEGGELYLNKPATNTSIIDGITIDVYQNKLRFFEAGGNNRGAYIDITAAANGVGTNLAAGSGTVTSVATGNGLTGGTITTTGTVSVLANNGITANTTGIFVTQGTGTVVNSTGVHVNSTYIGTLSANNASFLGGTAAASYQLNSTLNANIAAYLPTYTGVVNGSSYTVGSSFIANATGVYHTGTINATSYTVGTSFTANSTVTNTVSLVVSTNTATIGTGTYFVSNGNVGIGTSSPTQKLDVNGGIAITAAGARIVGDFINATVANRVLFQSSSANTNTSVGAIPNGTGTAASFTSINNSDPTNSAYFAMTAAATDARIRSDIIGTGAYIPITLWTGGSERMRIDNSGNVGIGTSSPSVKLDVFGPITSRLSTTGYSGIYPGDATNSGYFAAHDPSGVREVYTGYVTSTTVYGVWGETNKPMMFGTNNAERMRIAANGNIGIGTSSPNTKFVVSDNAVVPTTTQTGRVAHFVGSDTATARILIDSIASAVNISTRRANGTAASPSALLTGETLLNMGSFGYGATGYTAGARASITSTTAENWTDSAQGTYWTFSTTAIGSTTLTERMRIDASGNTGIGNSAPTHRLSVNGNAYFNDTVVTLGSLGVGTNDFTTDLAYTPKLVVSGLGPALYLRETDGDDWALSGLSNNFSIRSVPDAANSSTWTSPFFIGTGSPTNSLCVASNGNIGIGTSTPSYKLEIVSAALGASSGNTTNLIRSYTNTGNGDELQVLFSRKAAAAGWTTADLIIRRNVDSTANQHTIRFNGDTSTTFNWGASELMRITNGGNVGIGTTSPGHKLSIGAQTGGTSTATPDTISIGSTYSSAAGTNAKLRLFWDGAITYGFGVSSSQLDYIVSGAYSHVWYSNGSERMRIDSSGNVGIGTAATTARLTVGDGGDNQSGPGTAQLVLNGAGTIPSVTGKPTIFHKANIGLGLHSDWAMSFTVNGSSLTEAIRIDASGNVGIGRTPSYKLDVNGTTHSTDVYTDSTFIAGNFATTGTSGTLRITTASGASYIQSGLALTSGSAAPLIFSNIFATSEWARFNSSGNFGIGTSSPIARLDVSRYITHTHEWASKSYISGTWYRFLTLTAANAGQELRVVLRNPSGHDSVEITIAKHTTGVGNAGVVASIRRLGSYAYTYNITKIRICDDGTNSTTHLEVQFGANHTSTLNMGISGLMNVGFTVVDMTTGAVGTASTKELFVSDGLSGTTNQTMIGYSTLSDDLMYLNTNGNLGIGTTSPGNKLSIGSTASTSTATPDTMDLGGTFRNTAGGAPKLRVWTDGTNHFGIGVSSGQMEFTTTQGAAGQVWYTAGTEKMRLLANGNIGIGTASPVYKLEVNGSFAATTKSFVIDHPTKPDMKLRYGSLEGPENGVYVRGKVNGYVIELPDYWTGLVDEDTIAVQLTAIGEPQTLYVIEVSDNQVFINSDEGVPCCYYTVYGERKDVEKLMVEFEA